MKVKDLIEEYEDLHTELQRTINTLQDIHIGMEISDEDIKVLEDYQSFMERTVRFDE